MKMSKRILPSVLASLFLGAAATGAQAQQFSQVVVFGDSLSDAGYFRPFLGTLGLPASLVSTLGRFTTNPGPVWSELVTQHYGLVPNPSNAGGSIYAQGGARVAVDSASTPPGSAQRPVSTQITEYLAARNNTADPRALFTVWAGANDFLQNFTLLQAGTITPAQLQTNVLGAVTAEIGQVGRLYQAGARNVMLFLNYDPAATPQFAAADAVTRGSATQLAVGANTTALTTLAGAGLRPVVVDIFSLMNELKANPSAYGFSNSTGIACGPFPPITTSGNAQFCYSGNLVAANADKTYIFADGIHPTTATHAIFAQFAEALIDGPYAYSLLAEVPLSTRNGQIRSLNEGIAQGDRADVGNYTVFAAGDRGDFDVDSATAFAGVKSTNTSATVGVTTRVSEEVTLGAAFGMSKNDASFGGNSGGLVQVARPLWHRRGLDRQHQLRQHIAQHRPGVAHAHGKRDHEWIQHVGRAHRRLGLPDRPLHHRTDRRRHQPERHGQQLRRIERSLRQPAHRRPVSQVPGVERRPARIVRHRLLDAVAARHRRQGAHGQRAPRHGYAADAQCHRQQLRHPGLRARHELRDQLGGHSRHDRADRGRRRRLHQGLEPRGDQGGWRERDAVDALLKRVWAATNLPEAQLLADLLAEHGIRARVLNVNAQSLAGELPIEASLPQVWVDRPTDAARARELIDAYLRTPSGAPITCPRCGEENPSAFELCWSCKAPLQ